MKIPFFAFLNLLKSQFKKIFKPKKPQKFCPALIFYLQNKLKSQF